MAHDSFLDTEDSKQKFVLPRSSEVMKLNDMDVLTAKFGADPIPPDTDKTQSIPSDHYNDWSDTDEEVDEEHQQLQKIWSQGVEEFDSNVAQLSEEEQLRYLSAVFLKD